MNKKCEIFLAAAQNGLLDRPLLLRLPPPRARMGPAKQLYQIRRITYPAARFFTAALATLSRPVDAAPRRPAGQVPTHTGFGPPRPQMATGTPSVWYSWLLGTCGPLFNTWFIKIDGCAVC